MWLIRTAWDDDDSSPPDGATAPAALSIARSHACTLSFVAGFVDTCVFIALFGLFTAHVTGNLVLIGSEMVHKAPEDVFPKLLAFGVFTVAVMAAVVLDRWLHETMHLPTFLVIEGALLLLTPLAAGSSLPGDPNSVPALLAGSLAAAAMGFQNAMMRLRLPALPSTTVMTTNVTQAVIDATTLLLPAREAMLVRRRDSARKRFARVAPQIAWFTVGAAGGALGFRFLGMLALILPALLCDALAWRISRQL